MANPFSCIQLHVQAMSNSPIVDNPGFHISYSAPPASTPASANVTDLVNQFVTGLHTIPAGGTHEPSSLWNPCISRVTNSATVKAYDVSAHLSGTPAGSPIVTTAWTPSAAYGGTPMPEGCSCVITLQAPYGTDVEFAPGARPRARDRGRIYFGPLSANASTTGPNTESKPEPSFVTNLLKWIKAAYVYTTAPGSIPYYISVWSRKNSALSAILQAWIDDRFDYQRRRADQASTKTIQTLP